MERKRHARLADGIFFALVLASLPDAAKASPPPLPTAYTESESTQSTTSTAFQDREVLTFTAGASQYLLVETALFQNTNTSKSSPRYTEIQAVVGGTVYSHSRMYPPSTTNWLTFAAHQVLTFSAGSPHTIRIQYKTTNSGYTASVKNARIVAIPIGSSNQSEQAPETPVNNACPAGTWTTATGGTLQFSVPTPGDYLVIATAQMVGAATGFEARMRLIQVGVAGDSGEMLYAAPVANTMWRTYATVRKLTLSGVPTLKVQFNASTTSGCVDYKDARLTAIPLSDISAGAAGYGEAEPAATTYSTSLVTVATGSVTSTPSQPYAVLGTALLQGNSNTAVADVVGHLDIGGVSAGEEQTVPASYADGGNTNDYVSFFNMRQASWADSLSHSSAISYRTTTGIVRAGIKNARVLMMPVGFCSGKPDGTACPSDGNECHNHTCQGGVCDTNLADGTACTDDGNVCTTDTCSSGACTHPAGNGGTVCRASLGECDPAEQCTGSSATCPTDLKTAFGTSCTDDGNVCTLDQCDGSNVTCQHPAGHGGTTCRSAAPEPTCELDATCTGSSATCPANPVKPAATVCRAAAAEPTCDVAATCDGVSSTCPANGFKDAGTMCRTAAGVCDLDELCSGMSAACPSDGKVGAGVACTDDGNVCTADQCDGTNVTCQHTPISCPGGFTCDSGGGGCVPEDGPPPPFVLAERADLILGLNRATGLFHVGDVQKGTIDTLLPAFAAPTGSTATVTAPDSDGVCVADVDNDGGLDLVWASPTVGKVRWFRRLVGTWAFDYQNPHDIDSAAPPGSAHTMACADLDHDGDIDVVMSWAGTVADPIATNLYVYRNDNSSDSFTRTVVPTGYSSADVAALAGKSIGDFDGDGKPDLAIFVARQAATNDSPAIVIFRNTGSFGATAPPFSSLPGFRIEVPGTGGPATMSAVGPRWGALTANDADHDGDFDLWFMGNNKQLQILLGNGNLTFAAPALAQPGPEPYDMDRWSLLSQDITQDGIVDVVLASGSSDGTLRWFQGTGAGQTSATPAQEIGGFSTALALSGRRCTGFDGSTACSDGDACTTNDRCDLGECVGGAPLNCDDGNACTGEVCNPATGCESAGVVACLSTDCSTNLGCNTSTGLCESSPVPGHPACDTGNPCEISQCDGGACTVVGRSEFGGCAATTGGGPPADCLVGAEYPFFYDTEKELEQNQHPTATAQPPQYENNLFYQQRLLLNPRVGSVQFKFERLNVKLGDSLTIRGSGVPVVFSAVSTPPPGDGYSTPVIPQNSETGPFDGWAGAIDLIFRTDASSASNSPLEELGIRISSVKIASCRPPSTFISSQPKTMAGPLSSGLMLGAGDNLYFRRVQHAGYPMRMVLQLDTDQPADPSKGILVRTVPAILGSDFDIDVSPEGFVYPEDAPSESRWTGSRALGWDGTMAAEVLEIPPPTADRWLHIRVGSKTGLGHFKLFSYERPYNFGLHEHEVDGEARVCSGILYPLAYGPLTTPFPGIAPSGAEWNRLVHYLRAVSTQIWHATDGNFFIRSWRVKNRNDCKPFPTDCAFFWDGPGEDADPHVPFLNLYRLPSSSFSGCVLHTTSDATEHARQASIPSGSWDCVSVGTCMPSDDAFDQIDVLAQISTHELGHGIWHLDDEGANTDGCGHSVMGANQRANFCTDHNHARDPANKPGTFGPQIPGTKANSPSAWTDITGQGGIWPVIPPDEALRPGVSDPFYWDDVAVTSED